MRRRNLLELLVFVCAIALVPLTGLSDIALHRLRLRGGSSGETYYLPPAPVVRALSFGYNELGADLVWLKTVAYFTDHLVGDRDYRYLSNYLETSLALDDHFRDVYTYGAPMLMSRGEHQTNADVLRAIALLERAHRRFPNIYSYAFTIGAYYLSELRTRDKKQRAVWRRKAADWIHRAALLGANQPWLGTLAAKIYTQQGQREIAIKHLRELYLTTQDPKARQQLALKLRDLDAAQAADKLKAFAERLQKRYSSSKLGFVPPTLFLMLDAPEHGPFVLRMAGGPAKAPAK
ncbi:MAG: hypothetical protein KC503_10905 [Myxococcales bacterium]|nr:hypothetical protein [Myxococcales bacterium]